MSDEGHYAIVGIALVGHPFAAAYAAAVTNDRRARSWLHLLTRLRSGRA